MSIFKSALSGIRKAAVAGARGLLTAEGRTVSPLLRGALEYGGYNAAAWGLQEYAKGNFEHEGSKNVASVAAFFLRAKGVHSLALGGTRQIGELNATVADSFKGYRGTGAFRTLDNLRGPGSFNRVARTSKGRFTNTNYGSPYTLSSADRGSWDEAIAGLNPFKLAFNGAKFVGGGIVSFPGKAVTGAVEYGKVARNVWRATASSQGVSRGTRVASGWGTMALGLADIQHPLAPVIAGGLALGGAKAFAERYQRGPNGWEQSQYSAPLTYADSFEGPVGGIGSVDPTGFPGGMTVGRGRSAIRSQTVMEGQSAVTSKMLAHRRV